MFGKSQKAMADWPVTKPIKGGGVHVTGKYLPPAFVKPVQGIYGLMCFVAVFYVVAHTDSNNLFGALIAAGIGLYVLYRYVWLSGITQLLGKSVDVKILPDAIHVRNFFNYKKYARGIPIEFRVDRHQKALKEQAKEIETGQKQSSTYRQAVEVVMQYGENRIVIAELPETEMNKARALTMRLGMLNETRAERDAVAAPDGRELIFARQASSDFGRAPDIR